MKVLLIRPWVNKKITTVKNFLFGEPLGLECVSTILKEQGHEVLLADFMVEEHATLEDYLKKFEPEVVGITSQCTDVENVLAIAKASKQYNPDITVIVGGVQATVYPNSFFDSSVDHIFKSTTRANFRELMYHIQHQKGSREAVDSYDATQMPLEENDCSQKTTSSKIDVTGEMVLHEPIEGIFSRELGFENQKEFCYNEYVLPDTTSTARYRKEYRYVGFQPCAVIQTSFGCRNRCEFCVRWKLEGAALREVAIEKIVDQIEALDEPYVMICDNDFLINRKRLEKFCDLLEEKKIRKEYICYGSVNSILEKPDLFHRLKNNGLKAVIVGYESFDDAQLKKYNKAATTDENLKATEILRSSDIACWGSFILHPDWDKEDFKKLNRYKKLLKPELLTFSPLNPHPLTPLFEQYKDRLLYDEVDYDKWNFGDVLIMPSKMSLRDYYWEVLKFTFGVNLNWHSLKYTIKTFPLSNTLRMLFGFNTLISVYISNFKNANKREAEIRGRLAQATD